MRSFEIREFGIENLALAERDVPEPGANEVLVRIKAASLNYRDYLVVTGAYNPKLKRPMIPLSDAAGVVEETGSDVTRFRVGDRVAPCFFQTWIDGPPSRRHGASALGGAVDGVLREYAVFHEDGLVASPLSLSDPEVAALPCAALTAWHALFEHAPGAPGDTVLLLGTGGVSLFALQFAKCAGLRVLITSSSDEKLARARQMGARETIHYGRTANWEEEARKLTGGIGVDHVIEVGGSGTLPRSLRALRTDGVMSLIGTLTGADPNVSPMAILMNSLRIQGIYVGSRAMFERMNRALEFHAIKPVIDKVFPWTELPAALRYLESQKHMGKICLSF